MDPTQAEDILDDPRERRRLPVIGLWLTALYLAGLVGKAARFYCDNLNLSGSKIKQSRKYIAKHFL